MIDGLPEQKHIAVHTLPEVLVEPLSQALANAPAEEEELNSLR